MAVSDLGTPRLGFAGTLAEDENPLEEVGAPIWTGLKVEFADFGGFGGILTAALLRFINDVFLWSSLGGEKNHKQLTMIVYNYDSIMCDLATLPLVGFAGHEAFPEKKLHQP